MELVVAVLFVGLLALREAGRRWERSVQSGE